MNDARIQQVADPLTIATRPETELVARFMGDNNIIRGRVTQRDGDRLVVAGEHDVQTSVVAPGDSRAVGDEALVAVRAAAVEVDLNGFAAHGPNSADCEILFVEFLGDLVKLHLSIGSDRMLAKVPGESYPAFRGKEGARIRLSWKEEDVQLLRPEISPVLDRPSRSGSSNSSRARAGSGHSGTRRPLVSQAAAGSPPCGRCQALSGSVST
jgi:ABC-type Fe3+/spermidine/putrescine transport system ATPase subunit